MRNRYLYLSATWLVALALSVGLAVLPSSAHAATDSDGDNDSSAMPVEPDLAPVTATSCSGRPTAHQVTCLAQSLPIDDADVEEARDDQAAVPAPGEVAPLTVRTKTGAYTPADLADLYGIPATVRPGATVGIVDVGSDPNTEAQMAYFRRYFDLPACTSASGCFREVNRDGGRSLPATDSDWVTEIAIDVQAVTAVCPSCHLLLVDAPTSNVLDMARAAQTATRLGADYVSLSYGSSDDAGSADVGATYYDAGNVTYVAAAGDDGYGGGALFPASAPNVVAAGGTSVKHVSGVWQQSAWSGSGSGCGLQSASALQDGAPFVTACHGKRAVADVSALADPTTGMLIYRGGSWWTAGGTSLAAPIVAGLYALAGNHTAPMSVYENRAALHDVTTGSTGSCSPALLCQARTGWDGPTGLGTPTGLDALRANPAYIAGTRGHLTIGAAYPVPLAFRLTDRRGDAVPHTRVVLERRLADGGFTAIGSARTGGDGSVAFSDRPRAAAAYRVVFAGDVDDARSTSNAVATGKLHPIFRTVATGVTLRTTLRAPWGARLPGKAVELEVKRGHRWVLVRILHTDARGRAAARVRRGATYRWAYAGCTTWRVWNARATHVA